MSLYQMNLAGTKEKLITENKVNEYGYSVDGVSFGMTNFFLTKDGEPLFLIAGEFHFSRYDYWLWEEEIIKMKLNGINVITTYILWIYHEEEEGIFRWEESNNLRYFVELCQKHGMYVILRIGPFCHAECRNGGFPDWLYGREFQVRSNDSKYLEYVKRFYLEIGNQVNGYLFKEGGVIIGIQLENEYLHASAPWEFTLGQTMEYTGIGTEDMGHILVLKELAIEVGLQVPLYTMTGWDVHLSKENNILPMLGGYAYKPWCVHQAGDVHPPSDNYLFKDRHQEGEFPVAYCELMGGMSNWYKYRMSIPPESVSAIALNALAGGTNFIGYYMYHGGNNQIGQHCFLNEYVTPKINYDFHAPIGAFGQIRRSADLLRPLHYFMQSFQRELSIMGTWIPAQASNGKVTDTKNLRYACRTNGEGGFLFLNNFQDHWNMEDQNDIQISITTNNGVICFPQNGTFTLKKDVSCVLPFCLDLGGVNLVYSMCQPITSLRDADGDITWFFFIPNGVRPEYCIEGIEGIEGIEIDYGECNMENGKTYLFPEKVRSLIKIRKKKGNQIRICTLTSTEAEQFWLGEFWGQKRVILSRNCPLILDTGVQFSMKDTCGSLEFFPPIDSHVEDLQKKFENVPNRLESNIGTIKEVNYNTQSFFQSFELQVPEVQLNSTVEYQGSRGIIEVHVEDLDDVKELWLSVDYDGDVANAFVGGKLVNDDFYNGEIWEIGLKRYKDKLQQNPLCLYIKEREEGSYEVESSAMALKKKYVGEKIGSIQALHLTPEYEIVIQIAQQ